MNALKTSDYSPSQRAHFEEMHRVLTEFNARIGTKRESPIPSYSDEEMAEYSGYRQIVIAEECGD